jgi:hypothetical protein
MSHLFEVTFMVDQKRFGEVLALLDGKAYNVKHRLIRREAPTEQHDQLSLPSPELFMNKYERAKALLDKLKKDGVNVVKTKQMAELLDTEGNYMSTVMSRLAKERLIKRVKMGVFEIKKAVV